MTRALVVHPGTQHAIQMAAELNRLDALAGFHTGFVAGRDGLLASLIDKPGMPLPRKLSNRVATEVPAEKIRLQIGLELTSQILQAIGNSGQAHFHWRNERFQRSVPDRALAEADVVIGFDTSSWILAERCQNLRKPLILVQTTGHPDARAAANEVLANQFPDWLTTFEWRLRDVRQAEETELDGATLVVCASSFTRDTLIVHGVVPEKVRIIPLGVDAGRYSVAISRKSRPFRFIFVGAVTTGKGIPLLLQAWSKLARTGAELWLVGPIPAAARPLLPDLPGLHVWGGVPGNRVADMMRQCDVFVFPSYFEGFGLVILQAMACGLPVISTMATAAPDLLPAQGAGGWVLPTGQLEALEQAMAYCLAHQSEMPEIGKVARSIAERHGWQAYGQNWLSVLDEAISRVAPVEPPLFQSGRAPVRRGAGEEQAATPSRY